jgi:hypothetical protein
MDPAKPFKLNISKYATSSTPFSSYLARTCYSINFAVIFMNIMPAEKNVFKKQRRFNKLSSTCAQTMPRNW